MKIFWHRTDCGWALLTDPAVKLLGLKMDNRCWVATCLGRRLEFDLQTDLEKAKRLCIPWFRTIVRELLDASL